VTERTPPKLATALLKHLGPHDDSLLGDLREAYANGMSGWWYWCQVVGVIVQTISRDVRHSWLVVIGVMIYGIILTQFAPLLNAAIETFDEQLFLRGIGWFYVNHYGLPSVVLNHPWSITLALYSVIGWTVGRIAGPRHAAVVLAFAASVFVGSMMKPLTGFGVTYPMLQFRFRFGFHPIPFERILTQHFIQVDDRIAAPNGLVLSPDERVLYAADSLGETLVAFDVGKNGVLTNRRSFGRLEGGAMRTATGVLRGADGLAVDTEGRVYVATRIGVEVLSPAGQHLGTIPIIGGTGPQNLAFAGAAKQTLFVVGARAIWRIRMEAQGYRGRAK
jgi:hypothetical protein